MRPIVLAQEPGALPIKELEGVRLLVLALLFVPFAFFILDKQIRRFAPDGTGEEESSHGRDYYMGYTVGRNALKTADLDDLVRTLRREGVPMQLQHDRGGEKVFVARGLADPRGHSHELEAGVLSGGLFRATGTRYEVDEERCMARGEGYCRFVAIKG